MLWVRVPPDLLDFLVKKVYALHMICSSCNEEVEEYAKGKRCRKCYNAYMAEYMLNRYHRNRAILIEELGGKCIDCGSTVNLEFDHAESSDKEFDLAKGHSFSLEKLRKEVAKCVLRCRRCHIEKTRKFDLGAVEHGGGVSGKRNCPCKPCKDRKAEYMRTYKSSS